MTALTPLQRAAANALNQAAVAGIRALAGTPADHAAALRRIDQAQGVAMTTLRDPGDEPAPQVAEAMDKAVEVFHIVASALHDAMAVLMELDGPPDDAAPVPTAAASTRAH